MTNLDVAFNYLVLKDEGTNYVNDKNDSGGPTRWGITLKTYADFFHIKEEEVGEEAIEQMWASTAKQIYTANYWLPLSCDKTQDLGIACAIFDSGVLYGSGTIGLLTQMALSNCGVAIKLDGKFGDKSSELLNQYLGGGARNRDALMHAFQNLILEHIDEVIAEHPKNEKYRNGWTQRTLRLSRLLDDQYLNQFKQEMFS